MIEIEAIKNEYNELLKQLANPEVISNKEKGNESKDSSSTLFEELLKRKEYLEKIIEKEKEIEEIKKRVEENKIIVSAKEDAELVLLAETEITQLQEREKQLKKELESLLNEKISNSNKLHHGVTCTKKKETIIMEIRAGTGGKESALFAADLFRMYSKYGSSQDWKMTVLDCHYNDLGGIKQITFELKGDDAFSKMKWEAGVHRVQRIPQTEKSGRIHTSTASVAVLPKPEKGKIVINPSDIKVDTYKASGPGGQYVNKRMTAVRITHLPTGLVVTSQTERNLQQNRENALSVLEAKLLEKKEAEEIMKIKRERRFQIGKAQRAEKIRTYNFPQNRITDHRIKKSFHNLEEIIEGKLEPLISALQK